MSGSLVGWSFKLGSAFLRSAWLPFGRAVGMGTSKISRCGRVIPGMQLRESMQNADLCAEVLDVAKSGGGFAAIALKSESG